MNRRGPGSPAGQLGCAGGGEEGRGLMTITAEHIHQLDLVATFRGQKRVHSSVLSVADAGSLSSLDSNIVISFAMSHNNKLDPHGMIYARRVKSVSSMIFTVLMRMMFAFFHNPNLHLRLFHRQCSGHYYSCAAKRDKYTVSVSMEKVVSYILILTALHHSQFLHNSLQTVSHDRPSVFCSL